MEQNFQLGGLGSEQRKKIHIPLHDVDDLAFKNRHDPNFVASITNLMQVPATITLNNGSAAPRSYGPYGDKKFAMDIPEKLTADGILKNRIDNDYDTDSIFDDDIKDSNDPNTTATPPSTPTKASFIENANHFDEEKFSKTPQIAADLFKRMKPRRSSIEADLHAEIRILRDKLNNLEHECQVNTRSCRLLCGILLGYIVIKTFGWLVKSD